MLVDTRADVNVSMCQARQGSRTTCPSVRTFLPESLLVGVDEPAVPGHEVSSVMDFKRLLDVENNEVVELKAISVALLPGL